MGDSEAASKQSEEEVQPVALETTKRRKKEVQLDEQGNPIKAPRKPFEWTEKRKEAFEECKRKRAVKVAQRKEVLQLSKEAEREVRLKIKAWRTLMQSPEEARLIMSSSLSHTASSAQQTFNSTPTSAPDLTVLSTMPNVMPPQAPQPGPLPPLPTPQATSAAVPAQVSAPTQPQTQPQPQPQTQTQTQSSATTNPSASATTMEEEHMAASASEMFPQPAPTAATLSAPQADPRLQRQAERRFEVDEVPINGKRKAPHLRLGTGAGNHEPYEGEDGYEAPPPRAATSRYEQYERGTINVDDLSDEELALFMMQARQSAEQRSMFNVRRREGKAQRPSHSSMFLDHAYTHERSSHPSTLVARSLPQQPQGPFTHAQQYMWL